MIPMFLNPFCDVKTALTLQFLENKLSIFESCGCVHGRPDDSSSVHKIELECTHRVRTHAVLLLSVSPPSE